MADAMCPMTWTRHLETVVLKSHYVLLLAGYSQPFKLKHSNAITTSVQNF